MHATHTHRHTNRNTEQETTYSVVDWRWQGQTVEWEELWEGRVESGRYWPNPEVLHYQVIEGLTPSEFLSPLSISKTLQCLLAQG